ncbi:MAG: hypothetical protein RPS47_00345, partial [Colwellia sp.]
MNIKENFVGYEYNPESPITVKKFYDEIHQYSRLHKISIQTSEIIENKNLTLSETCHSTIIDCLDFDKINIIKNY